MVMMLFVLFFVSTIGNYVHCFIPTFSLHMEKMPFLHPRIPWDVPTFPSILVLMDKFDRYIPGMLRTNSSLDCCDNWNKSNKSGILYCSVSNSPREYRIHKEVWIPHTFGIAACKSIWMNSFCWVVYDYCFKIQF